MSWFSPAAGTLTGATQTQAVGRHEAGSIGWITMKTEFFVLSKRFIRDKFVLVTSLIGVLIVFVITSCSFSEKSSASYLPVELEEAVRQDAVQFFTTTGFEPLRLDKVAELTIRDIRHPAMQSTSPSGSVVNEIWCLTTIARGTVNGAFHEVTQQWFGLKEDDGWVVIPRHVVAYPAFWDDACEEAERLDS